MLLHLARSETVSWLGCRRYCLQAHLELSPAERAVIFRHRLDAREIYVTPLRQQLTDRARVARNEARAIGLLDATAKLFKPPPLNPFATENQLLLIWLAKRVAAVVLGIRARFAFAITIGDLCRGDLAVHNAALAAVTELEAVMTHAIDEIDDTVAAAVAYEWQHTNTLAPATAAEPGTRPSEWLR